MHLWSSLLVASALVARPVPPPIRHRPCVMVATAVGRAAPGSPDRQDDSAFCESPAAFAAQGVRAHGPVFSTGVAGGSIFVGDAAALAALSAAPATAVASRDNTLAAPFALSAGVDLLAEQSDEFNAVCYDEIFKWIPRYKEAGFSTFRFEDFIDGRIRRLLPSMRLMVLHSAAPLHLGVPFAELPRELGFENVRSPHCLSARGRVHTMSETACACLTGGGAR